MEIHRPVGFDNEKYLKMQSEHIRQRIAQFGDKLYLEFGGAYYHVPVIVDGAISAAAAAAYATRAIRFSFP